MTKVDPIFMELILEEGTEDGSEVTECISGYQRGVQEPVLGSAPGPVGRYRACLLH